MNLFFKTHAGNASVDEAEGIVECFVAAIGNKDSVNDIILPGAFDASLKRRKPRVVWGHDWNHPIGKVLDIYEVQAGDYRLPQKIKEAGAGGLFARVQFNLKSEKGKEAFANVAFYGEEQEWCLPNDTEILTQRGWLTYDQLTTDDLAYTLDEKTMSGRFVPVLAVNTFEAKERQLRHVKTKNFSSLTTMAHRWPLFSPGDGSITWSTTAELDHRSRVIRSAPNAEAPTVAKWSDAFVEVVAWYWTEGWRSTNHPDKAAYIGQSQAKNPIHTASIRRAVDEAFLGEFTEQNKANGMVHFRIKKEGTEQVLGVTGDHKAPTPEFLISLTKSQLELFIARCFDGDGHDGKVWYQVEEHSIRMFEMACALAGIATHTRDGKDYGNRFGRPPMTVQRLYKNMVNPLGNQGKQPAIDEMVAHDGIVWCPTTETGTWLARREGSVYFTGNSVGYKTIVSSFDNAKGANLLKEMELFEVSPVLHGANQLTGTISVKSADTKSNLSTGQEADLARSLAEFMRVPVVLREATGEKVLFDTVDDGEVKTYETSFDIHDGEYRFKRARPMIVETVVKPAPEVPASMGCSGDCACGGKDAAEGDCGCGGKGGECSCEKTLPLDEKSGRVLSTRNLKKLQDAIAMIQEVLSASGVEMKADDEEMSLKVHGDVNEFLAFVRPVMDYHKIDTPEAFEGGVKLLGVSAQGKSALQKAFSSWGGTVEFLGEDK